MGHNGPFPYELKPVRPDDQEALKAFSRVHVAAFEAQNENGWEDASVKASLESPGMVAFLFVTEGQPAGGLMVRLVCDEAELITVAVHPDWQSKGVGRTIIDYMLEFLHTKNIATCFLEVRKDNAKAVELYMKTGFVQVGVRRNYYQDLEGKRSDALLYSFDLLKEK